MPAKSAQTKPSIPLSDWASLTCSLIWIYDQEVPAYGNHRAGITNQESAVWLLREGEADVRTKKTHWRVQPGEWFFVPEVDYWQDFSPQARLLSLRFRATWITGIPLFHHGEGLKLKAANSPQLENAALPLLDYFTTEFTTPQKGLRAITASTRQYMQLQMLLMGWLDVYVDTLIEQGLTPTRLTARDPRMISVARSLNNWPLDQALDEEHIAAQVHLSSRQLSRLFQKDFNMTPSRYFFVRKLETAKDSLENYERPIKEIALSLGFKSMSHFSTWFRKQCGQSPREYRDASYQHQARES